MEIIEQRFGEFLVTTDRTKMDVIAIHDFLANHSGWSNDIPLDTVQTSINNLLNFGLFHHHIQIGFAIVIADFATITYLGDNIYWIIIVNKAFQKN